MRARRARTARRRTFDGARWRDSACRGAHGRAEAILPAIGPCEGDAALGRRHGARSSTDCAPRAAACTPIGPLRIGIADPFGLARVDRDVGNAHELVVTPRVTAARRGARLGGERRRRAPRPAAPHPPELRRAHRPRVPLRRPAAAGELGGDRPPGRAHGARGGAARRPRGAASSSTRRSPGVPRRRGPAATATTGRTAASSSASRSRRRSACTCSSTGFRVALRSRSTTPARWHRVRLGRRARSTGAPGGDHALLEDLARLDGPAACRGVRGSSPRGRPPAARAAVRRACRGSRCSSTPTSTRRTLARGAAADARARRWRSRPTRSGPSVVDAARGGGLARRAGAPGRATSHRRGRARPSPAARRARRRGAPIGPDRERPMRADRLPLTRPRASRCRCVASCCSRSPRWRSARSSRAAAGGGCARSSPPACCSPARACARCVRRRRSCPCSNSWCSCCSLTSCSAGPRASRSSCRPGHLRGVRRRSLSGAQRTIEQQSVPAIPVPPLLFALALGIGLLAFVVDVLVQTLRVPALAAVPALVPSSCPGFIIEAGAEAPALVAHGSGVPAAAAGRRAGAAPCARSLPVPTGDDAATIVPPEPGAHRLDARRNPRPRRRSAFSPRPILAASTPSISSSLLLGSPSQGTLFGARREPLHRPRARPAAPRGGARPSTTSRATAIARTSPCSRSTSSRARCGAPPKAVDGDNTVERMPRPEGLSDEVETTEHPIERDRRRGAHDVAPACPYPTSRIEGLSGSWFWDDGSAHGAQRRHHTGGQRYGVTRLEVDPTAAQLRGAGATVPDGARPTRSRCPRTCPRRSSRDDGSSGDRRARRRRYDAAVAIQQYLRGSEFDYSVEAPVDEGYDGGGFDVIAEFLEKQGGVLRALRLDDGGAWRARSASRSRISVGYTPGAPTQERVDGVQSRRRRLARPARVARALLRGRRLGAVRADSGSRHRAVYSRPGAGDDRAAHGAPGAPSTPGRERAARGRPRPRPRRAGRRARRRRTRAGSATACSSRSRSCSCTARRARPAACSG